MSATIIGTKQLLTEFAGQYKLVTITAPIAATSDTIAITLAAHGITTVYAIVGATITGGQDAAFTNVQVTKTSGTSLTVLSKKATGAAADEFTGTTVVISVLGA